MNEIRELLQAQDYEQAALLANKLNKEELADVLTEIEKADVPAFCRALDSDLLARILVDKMFSILVIAFIHCSKNDTVA